MAKTTLFFLLALWASPLLAQRTEGIRLDSVSPTRWYFVRSAVTQLPDSSLVLDEQWKHFNTGKKARAYVREMYQVEIAQDSARVARLQGDIADKKKERAEILKKDKGKSPARSTEAPTPPKQPAKKPKQ